MSLICFFVKKKDGSLCLITDYRTLNAVTVKKCYPLLLIRKLLDQLGGCSIFSKINLIAGYNQVCIVGQDVLKTAFKTKYRAHKSVVINFGMTNTLSTLITLMNTIFKPLLSKCVIIYLDDIIVLAKPKKNMKIISI